MVRNMTGGKGHKKGKRSNSNSKRIIEYADEISSLYGLVISPLGDCKFLVHCNDNNDRIGLIRGSLYKNTFITPGDVVLVTLREFEQIKPGSKERCDIIIKYMPGEIDQLKKKQVFYLNSNNPFNLTLDKGKGKTSKDIDNDTEGISFNNNIAKQATLKDLPDIDDEDEDADEKESKHEEVEDLTNEESESDSENEDEQDDEYGNNKKYVEKELTSKSAYEEEESEEEQEEQEKEEPIPQFKNKRGVYTNDDDFM